MLNKLLKLLKQKMNNKDIKKFDMSPSIENKDKEIIEDLQQTNKRLQDSVEQWSECAKHYAFRLKDAYKGHLLVRGISERVAESNSQQVLDKYNSCSFNS